MILFNVFHTLQSAMMDLKEYAFMKQKIWHASAESHSSRRWRQIWLVLSPHLQEAPSQSYFRPVWGVISVVTKIKHLF